MGVTAEVSDFQEEEREDLGLNEVPKVDSAAVQEIFAKTGLLDLIKKKENEEKKE
jgi:hypothetical protein